MSGRGGIYKGPNGEKLYGDGREVKAEPSPAPPAERVIEVAPQGHSVWTPEKEQEMLEKAAGRVERMNPNDNEANMIAAVLRETLPEVAPQEEIPPRPPKQPAVHGCGEIYLVPDVEDYVKRMESSLTAAREERDRAREALRGLMDGLDDYWTTTPEGEAAVVSARAALKHVSDRQPEGEKPTRCDFTHKFHGRCTKPAGHTDPHLLNAPLSETFPEPEGETK